jgi:hypothetical protein
VPSFSRFLGVELDETSAKEKLVSGLGGAVGVLLVYVISAHVLGLAGASIAAGAPERAVHRGRGGGVRRRLPLAPSPCRAAASSPAGDPAHRRPR